MNTFKRPVATLHISGLPGGNQTLALAEGESLRIGRFEGNDLILPFSKASRFHAVINAGEGALFLTDLASLNGTYVNEKRVTAPLSLHTGDRIQIGDATLLVELDSPTGSQRALDAIVDSGSTQPLDMKIVHASILVCDVSGYTRMSEALPPEDVTSMLNMFLETAAKVVKSFDGTIEKTIGDSLMAIWRGSNTKDGAEARTLATQAVRAAIVIEHEINALISAGRWKHQALIPWRFRTSLNSGEALEGVVASGEVREFTILGDTVNIAFRLNDLATSLGCGIVLAEGTAALVRDALPLRTLGSVSVDGRQSQVDVFTIDETAR